MRRHNRVDIFSSDSKGKIFENLFKKPLGQKSSNLLAR
jgi:hypothetical protein